MKAMVSNVPVHYAEYGTGTPVLALHGAGVDHREIAGALEPVFRTVPGFRRLYPDLPGMGGTPAPETITSNDDVLEILLGFIESAIGDESFLVIGQSYGGYLARAIASWRPKQAVGLAIICPVGAHTHDVPKHQVLVSTVGPTDKLGSALAAGYSDYFVVQTAETLRRFQEYVAPGMSLVDESSLVRIFSHWQLRDRPEAENPYSHPVLILAGRQDATAGHAGPWELIEDYPRATFAVLDCAGHALVHEQPDLTRALVVEWLTRVRERSRT